MTHLKRETGGPRIGIVGCGAVGELHRDRMLAEGVDIVAISDPDADSLSRMAARLPRRPQLFRSELDLLAAGVVDAVVLCTPHGHHAIQANHALDANVHVLVEKPFVTSTAAGSALVAKATERGLALFVAYTRRSRGHARFLQIAAHRIAPLHRIAITRAQPWFQTHRRTWRIHGGEGGGFLLDAGASMLDLLLTLIPESIHEVDAVLERPNGVEVDVRGSVRLTFSGGVRVELSLIGDATEKIEQFQLYGEHGTAGWLLREDAPHQLYLRPPGGPSEIGDPATHRTLSPDAAFVAALRSGRSFGSDTARDLYDAASAIPVVALIERIQAEAVWK